MGLGYKHAHGVLVLTSHVSASASETSDTVHRTPNSRGAGKSYMKSPPHNVAVGQMPIPRWVA